MGVSSRREPQPCLQQAGAQAEGYPLGHPGFEAPLLFLGAVEVLPECLLITSLVLLPASTMSLVRTPTTAGNLFLHLTNNILT